MTDLSYEYNCACASLRRTTRAITQYYDQVFRPVGMRSTQLSVLSVLSHRGKLTFGELGEHFLMDQTTVTRNINIMKKLGLITVTAGEHDARKKYIAISEAGAQKLAEAIPLWKQAHSKITQGLGEERFDELMKLLKDVERLVE